MNLTFGFQNLTFTAFNIWKVVYININLQDNRALSHNYLEKAQFQGGTFHQNLLVKRNLQESKRVSMFATSQLLITHWIFDLLSLVRHLANHVCYITKHWKYCLSHLIIFLFKLIAHRIITTSNITFIGNDLQSTFW